jgi:hypothetical protein
VILEAFWLPIGARIRVVATRRDIWLARALAARAFEHWRCGRIRVPEGLAMTDEQIVAAREAVLRKLTALERKRDRQTPAPR